VSPTYATELQTEAFGLGFEGVLRARSRDLVGILNGIDEGLWDPLTDEALPARYSAASRDGKAVCRTALQNEMGLDADAGSLLVCVVSRLTGQKGLDMLIEVLPALLDLGGQVALLGTGEPPLEAAWRAAAASHPGRVAVRIAYDEPLSHRLIAGADAILVPSRFEPCGLTQLYGLRYGTVPIVARTGGLADSVVDANVAALEAGVATGIVFEPVRADGLARGLKRAVDLFRTPGQWERLVGAAMRQPVGWAASAARYKALYEAALAERDRPLTPGSPALG
jgi:starch synthase